GGATTAETTAVGVPPSQAVPSPLATPIPHPSSATELTLNPEFTSTRNGYTFLYPEGWDATPASTAWAPGTVTDWGNPALDVVRSSNARFVAASQLLEPGQTPEQWYVAYCDPYGKNQACRDYATTWEPIAIGSDHDYV